MSLAAHLNAALDRWRDQTEAALQAALQAAAPFGLLVLVDREGWPTRHGPHPSTPPGEITARPDPDPAANGQPRVVLV